MNRDNTRPATSEEHAIDYAKRSAALDEAIAAGTLSAKEIERQRAELAEFTGYRRPVGPFDIEPMLRYFAHSHLPDGPLRSTSAQFAALAEAIVSELPRSPERTVALRKLLEAKDAAVRCALDLTA